jgi:hypothetical protein
MQKFFQLYVHGFVWCLWLQLNLTAGEELEIEYEVDGWFSVRR